MKSCDTKAFSRTWSHVYLFLLNAKIWCQFSFWYDTKQCYMAATLSYSVAFHNKNKGIILWHNILFFYSLYHFFHHITLWCPFSQDANNILFWWYNIIPWLCKSYRVFLLNQYWRYTNQPDQFPCLWYPSMAAFTRITTA